MAAIKIYIPHSFAIELNFMRRPKGIKTRKSVTKRFKITATGKVLRPRAGAVTWPKPRTPSACADSASPQWLTQLTSIASSRTSRSATDFINLQLLTIYQDACYKLPSFPQTPWKNADSRQGLPPQALQTLPLCV